MADPLRLLIHYDKGAPLLDRLRTNFPDVVATLCDSHEGLPNAITTHRPDAVYSVRFSGTAPFPRDAFFSDDGPRWIANGGVGTDHFGRWDTTRVTVTNAAGVAAGMMAEYVIGGFLHFTLDLAGLQADKAARHWNTQRLVRPLAEQTLLIVGLGHTGAAVAARAKAFGMRVIGTRANPQPMENVDHVGASRDLRILLPDADFIALSTPLIPATRGLIGAAEFAMMKSGVIIADVSRGGVMDQQALLGALQSGHVAGAVLDVFETEPLPPDHGLWAEPNAVLSPHCSSTHEGWEIASFDLFLDNLRRWQTGDALVNIVDPARGY
jgi:phosphoglycerate dehydrogenase-like enzyme